MNDRPNRVMPLFVDLERQEWLHAPSVAELSRRIDRLCALVVCLGCAALAGWLLFAWVLFSL